MNRLELEDHLIEEHKWDAEPVEDAETDDLEDEHELAHHRGQLIWNEHKHHDSEQPAGKYAVPGDEDF